MRGFWWAWAAVLAVFAVLLLGALAVSAWRRVTWPRRMRQEMERL